MGIDVKVTVKSNDSGIGKFWNAVHELGSLGYVKVGVLDDGGPGSEKSKTGLTVARIAAIHEFGSGKIPERSFMRSTFAEQRPKYVRAIRGLIRDALLGKIAPVQTLQTLGLRLASDMKRKITAGDGVPPPNAPSTISRKGSFRTLVDTGRMLAAITWAYVSKGG